MSVAAIPVHTNRLPSLALRRFAWGVLIYFIAVILWGGLVRATGRSGLRRPLAALQRNGNAAFGAHRHHDRVHASHYQRSLVFCRCRAARVDPGRHGARPSGARGCRGGGGLHGHRGDAGGVSGQARADRAKPLAFRAPYLALHLTNTLLLLAALALTAHLLSRQAGYLRDKIRLVAPFGAIASLLVVLIVGVTGSLAALGDTLFPASSLGAALAQDFSATSGWLVRWRWTHPIVAVLAGVFLIWLLMRAAQHGRTGTTAACPRWCSFFLSCQYVLGVLDVTLLAPVWLQIVHLLGADVLWAALVVLAARIASSRWKKG